MGVFEDPRVAIERPVPLVGGLPHLFSGKAVPWRLQGIPAAGSVTTGRRVHLVKPKELGNNVHSPREPP